MTPDYNDIRSRIAEQPTWYDDHGVPRYGRFTPWNAPSIYANEMALVEIGCQGCDLTWLVSFTRSDMDDLRARLMGREPQTLAESIRKGELHYGDPPNHVDTDHAGSTMNCLDWRVIEYCTARALTANGREIKASRSTCPTSPTKSSATRHRRCHEKLFTARRTDMRFQILKPTTQSTYDPTKVQFRSLEELYGQCSPLGEHSMEFSAVAYVRFEHRDSVAMLVPIKIGSGCMVAMGILSESASRQQINTNEHIPFVCLVIPIAENDRDRAWLRKPNSVAFTETLWKLHPINPVDAAEIGCEVRATDLRAPVYTTARVGVVRGKKVIYVNVGGIEMSLTLDERA